MKPMLARTYGPKYNRFPAYVQPKLNGVRALYQSGVMQSRDEKLWRNFVLKHIVDELMSVNELIDSRILDGELYCHGWKLQRINGAVATNRSEPREDTHEVCFHVFDVLNPHIKFSDRWIEFSNTLRSLNLPHVKVVDTSYVHDEAQARRYFEMATAEGYEGIMLRPDGPYEFGETAHHTQKRSEFLWKYKSWQDAEWRCIGVTQGEGKADIGIGALILDAWKPDIDKLLLGAAEPPVPFKVGTGFDDNERIDFMQNPPIGKLVRVRYLELTEDGIPFNPSFIAVMQ